MAHHDETTEKTGIARLGLKSGGEDVQAFAYRMPAKRSRRVIDNWREPTLIIFDRLNICDQGEVQTFRALEHLRSLRTFRPLLFNPSSQEEAQELVDKVLLENKAYPAWDYFDFIPDLATNRLQHAQSLTHEVLTRLASHAFDLAVFGKATEFQHELHVTPTLSPSLEGPKLGFHFHGLPPELEDGRTVEKRSEGYLYFTVGKIAVNLSRLVWENQLLINNPSAKSPFAFCPSCQRVFEKSRSNRRYCSDQCASVFTTRESINRKKIS